MIDGLQLDLACAIVRMEQAAVECANGTALGDLLVERLATCDARRLRQYVTRETWDQLGAESDDARPRE